MKKLLALGFFIITILFFVSCDNEPITDIGVIQTELKTVVKDNNITKCSVLIYYDYTSSVQYSNSDFSISNGSLIIKYVNYNGDKYEKRYNLLYLSNYTYSGSYIDFYFSGIKD